MRVRGIQVKDVGALVELARTMHAESATYGHIPFSDVAMRTWFFMAAERPADFFCTIAESDTGEMAGAILAAAVPFIFSENRMAADLGLFVFEQFRGSRAAFMLVGALEDWAEAQQFIRVATGVSAGINDPLASKFYEKLGYKPQGVSFYKEFNT